MDVPKPKRKRRGETTRELKAVTPRIGTRMGALLVVQGADSDLGRQVVCNDQVTIGRSEDAELTLTDYGISELHCSIEVDEETGHYVLMDLNSTNGTVVNFHEVAAKYPLSTGDKIFVGDTVVRFSLSDAVDLEYQTKVQHLVYTDPLTGLGSRRHYDVVYGSACQRALMDNSMLTLMVLDMDGLKSINDHHGHEAGSYCITRVAHFIREVLGQFGTLHRFGGDEFVGCFPGMPHEKALEMGNQLRKRIEEHEFSTGGAKVAPTLSIGVATYPQQVQSPSALFGKADRALYLAKERGKNQVVSASDLDD